MTKFLEVLGILSVYSIISSVRYINLGPTFILSKSHKNIENGEYHIEVNMALMYIFMTYNKMA